jgi:hypothetical protein
MQANKISKQMIEFQKMSFENWFTAMSLVQDQAASVMDTMLGKATWLPEDGRDAIQNWVGIVQDERTRFKGYVDSGFASLEKVFTAAPKKTAKAKKAAS